MEQIEDNISLPINITQNRNNNSSGSPFLNASLLTDRIALLGFLSFWSIQVIALSMSSDWKIWLSTPDGLPGYNAGLISSLLSIILFNRLYKKIHNALISSKNEDKIINFNNTLFYNIRSYLSIFLISIIWVVTVFFWKNNDVPFTSLTWLITCLISVAINIFCSMSLLALTIYINYLILRADISIVFTTLGHSTIKSIHKLKKIFDLSGISCSFTLLALASWSYYLFVLGSLKSAQVVLTIGLSAIIASILVLPYIAVIFKLHHFMRDFKDELLEIIEIKLAKILEKNIKEENISEENKRTVETLNIHHTSIKKMTTWPFSLEDYLKVIISFTINLAPYLMKGVKLLSKFTR